VLADRINKVNFSQTMKISAEARKLSGEGIHIVDLSAGEPDFPTPQNIKDAAIDAVNRNFTRYTLNAGTIELRKAVANKLKTDNELEYNINDIVVSNGAKQSIFNAIHTVVNIGDEVIIPSPYWVSYPEMVILAHGTPVIVKTNEENNFKILPEQLQSSITEETKALILCNPSNPTGAAYTEEELESIAKICRKYDFYIISDEIYEKILYDNFRYKSFAALKGMKERTILVNGVSKAYSMTGWRIGYAAGPENIIRGIDKIQGHSTSNASSISQAAAIEALSGPQDYLEDMQRAFAERRNYLFNEITSIEGISCVKPNGAFYLFPNISKYFGMKTDVLKITDSFDFAMYLLYQAGVAVVPGISFGAEGYIRISYASSMENLKIAADRIRIAVSKLY
jgi:aspartate aminotransferase